MFKRRKKSHKKTVTAKAITVLFNLLNTALAKQL